MPIALVGSDDEAPQPRTLVLRSFGGVRAAIALANAGIQVVAVLRLGDDDRTRVLDVLTGWALGSGGDDDQISPNALTMRAASVGPVHLARRGLVSAVERAFEGDGGGLTRAEEARLRPAAAAGDVDARRRLVDAYAEIATLLAAWLRPTHLASEAAVRRAQGELDAVVGSPGPGSVLIELVERIASRLGA
jgi:hypothetical protein